MAEASTKRLNQAAKDLNVGTSTIVDYLTDKGHSIENKPTTKLTAEQVTLLDKAFASSVQDKKEAEKVSQAKRQSELEAAAAQSRAAVESRPAPAPEPAPAAPAAAAPVAAPTVETPKPAAAPAPAAPAPVAEAPKPAAPAQPEPPRVPGLKVLGKIELDSKGRPVRPKAAAAEAPKAPEPKAEAPKAPEPKAEAPKAVEPKAAAPKAETPKAPAPKAEAPKAPEPKAEAPKAPTAPAPEAKAPEVKAPAAEAPKAAETKPADAKPTPAAATPAAPAAEAEAAPVTDSTIVAKADQLKGLTVLGKIELPADSSRRGRGARPVASSDVRKSGIDKKKRQRIPMSGPGQPGGGAPRPTGTGQGARPTGTGPAANRAGGRGGNTNTRQPAACRSAGSEQYHAHAPKSRAGAGSSASCVTR